MKRRNDMQDEAIRDEARRRNIDPGTGGSGGALDMGMTTGDRDQPERTIGTSDPASEAASSENPSGAGGGAVFGGPGTRIAERGAGDESAFDASDAYTGVESDDAVDQR